MLEITEYSGNRDVLENFMEELQDYLIKIDPLKRNRKSETYGKVYTDHLLRKVGKNCGMIYIAEFDGKHAGMVAGILENQTEEDRAGHIEAKTGIIIELVVKEEYRGKKIGLLLMNKIEEYFRVKNCDSVWVDVFAPNEGAHAFYKKAGFCDRMIGMIKELC